MAVPQVAEVITLLQQSAQLVSSLPPDTNLSFLTLNDIHFHGDSAEMEALNQRFTFEVTMLASMSIRSVQMETVSACFERIKSLFHQIRALQSIVSEECVPRFKARMQRASYMARSTMMLVKASILDEAEIPDSSIENFEL